MQFSGLSYVQDTMSAPKSTGAPGTLSWPPSSGDGGSRPPSSDGSSAKGASMQSPPHNTYYERELDRLKSWHPQQSRFRTECERKSGGGAPAAPHSFFHARATSISPEQR